ncbi:hypothetical protein NERG_00428 [Nematocida ausubeli]|uniref:3'(2'),5'-bisphosphate nucleotidase n=1 Tax=Nematocida ausubeli (strain ATCC PRA-371 / ERTm2) TaxID=1913371 RepID=H8ZA07_NEMA1|nr:hypothetical protein NERG_00428 [Nematocida ausubeli]
MTEITEEIFKCVMKGICCASHLAKGAPLISSRVKSDMSVVSLYDVVIQMIFCKLLEKYPLTIVSEEEDNDFYKDTLKALQTNNISQEYAYIKEFLIENEISLEEPLKPVCHSLAGTGMEIILDPIDGTRGFINSRSYSIVAACMKDKKVLFSVISCPKENIVYYKWNMPENGLSGYPHRRRVRTYSLSDSPHTSYSDFLTTLSLYVAISAEKTHSSPILTEFLDRLSKLYPVHIVRMDGQGKYACVATQKIDIFLRLPSTKIQEKIWDHCAGIDMNEMSIVTDLHGIPIHPCTPPAYGVIASHSQIFHSLSLNILKDLLM